MSELTNTTVKAPDISKQIFGGILDYDGMGFYPGVELLNFVYGTEGETLLPSDDPVKILRKAHDFARRLVWDEEFNLKSYENDVLYDEASEAAIRHLMECLQLEIPNLKKKPTWERAHFFPYTKSLLHWDARSRTNRIQIERRYFRGGGAFAYHILRKDKNKDRLELCRQGFDQLFSGEKNSALEKLASVLLNAGVSDDVPQKDQVEPESILAEDGLEDLYRDGIVRILKHTELSSLTRIRSVINWTGFWLIHMQHIRAAESLGEERGFIICDFGTGSSQLRRASQRCLREMQSTILDAVDKAVSDQEADMSKKQRDKIKSFFWATAASIKILNAWMGRRHFTLGLNILEALVLASTEPKGEIPYEVFIDDWLFEKYNIITGKQSAEKNGLLSIFDSSVFEDNEASLATQMQAAGLLTQYSDATRMISAGII